MASRAFHVGRGSALAYTLNAAQGAFALTGEAATLSDSATAFDFYISTTGSDTNVGSLASPWALTSFENTSSNLTKMTGKRIGILPGSYSLAGFTNTQTGNFDAAWLNVPVGSSGSPTYIGSSDSGGHYSPRTATIVWSGGPSTCSMLAQYPNGTDNGGYVTIDGIVFNGNSMQAGSVGSGNYAGNNLLRFSSSSYSRTSSNNATIPGIIIQNCELYGLAPNQPGQNNALLGLIGCYGAVVQNNYFHDVVPTGSEATPGSGNPSHCALTLEIGCYGNQYLNNTFYNGPGGIWVKEGSTGTIAAYNYLYAIGMNGTYGSSEYCSPFVGWDDNSGAPNTGPSGYLIYQIHHNVMDSCVGAHYNVDSAPGSKNSISAWNNTVYDAMSGTWNGWQLGTQSSANAEFYNNIYVTSNSSSGGGSLQLGKININSSASNFSSVDYNCYYAIGGSYGSAFWGLGSSGKSTFASWQSAIQALVSGSESHSIASDPQFTVGTSSITPGNGPEQFALGSSSPAKAGTGSYMGAWDGVVTQIGCSFKQSGPWP